MRIINIIAFLIGLFTVPLYNLGFTWAFDEVGLGIPVMIFGMALPIIYILFVVFLHAVQGSIDQKMKYHFRVSIAFLLIGIVAGAIGVRLLA